MMDGQDKSIFHVHISKYMGTEYIGMFNDMARFLTIQIAIQMMLYTLDPAKFAFFSSDFMMLLIFIIVGVLLYWLIFKKIVSFT